MSWLDGGHRRKEAWRPGLWAALCQPAVGLATQGAGPHPIQAGRQGSKGHGACPTGIPLRLNKGRWGDHSQEGKCRALDKGTNQKRERREAKGGG